MPGPLRYLAISGLARAGRSIKEIKEIRDLRIRLLAKISLRIRPGVSTMLSPALTASRRRHDF